MLLLCLFWPAYADFSGRLFSEPPPDRQVIKFIQGLLHVYVCVRACVHACVRACVCVCVHMGVCVFMHASIGVTRKQMLFNVIAIS